LTQIDTNECKQDSRFKIHDAGCKIDDELSLHASCIMNHVSCIMHRLIRANPWLNKHKMTRRGLPEPISRLIEALSKLPGIGEKNATRLSFHILKAPAEFAESLSKAIMDTKSKVSLCPVCYSFTSEKPCEICRDERREKTAICVVEEPLDLIAIERSGEFNGKYHVLHGVISPIEGVGPEDLKIKELLERLRTDNVKEVIIATNPSVEGEATALYLAKIVKPLEIEVSRIAHGIPVGGDIEYIDEITLGKALRDRKKM